MKRVLLAGTDRDSWLPPKWVLTLLLAAAFFWVVSELKEIVVLLVVGYCVAYLIDPILDKFESKGISRSLGIIIMLVVVLLVVGILAVTALPTLVKEYKVLVRVVPEYYGRLKGHLLPYLGQLGEYLPHGVDSGEIAQLLPDVNPAVIGGVVAKVSSALGSGYSTALALFDLVLLPFIVFYLAIDIDRFHKALLGLFPVDLRDKVAKLFCEIDRYVSAFVRGQLMVGFVLFLLYAIGLGIVGIELWFLLALISGFGNIVPYLGFLVGVVFSSIMALFTYGDFTHVLYVWVVFAIVQALEGTVITPKIIGDKIGLSPLLVILAIFAGGKLFGFLGIFLAVPCAAILRVLVMYPYNQKEAI
ncbi:MAG: AI-2E family transporter [Candidatus Dadabacteria bacterium]|nr:MAG: AI-2E family transporter [Candidatus Dadabacteria bacterium]